MPLSRDVPLSEQLRSDGQATAPKRNATRVALFQDAEQPDEYIDFDAPAPNTWFCEWEQCVKIVSKDWKDSEKNSKHLSVNPHEEGMWRRAPFVFWKEQSKNMSAANNKYEGWLNKAFREQEQRMKKQEKLNK